ncbi:MAG: phosphatase PAP2 family protein [Lachnospiraceae bacterium]|nr:phosphatase PAP2 family protein [Lachnospiraceae bacterium]
MLENLAKLDADIVMFFQEYVRNPVLTKVLTFFTTLGNVAMIWIAISLGLSIYRRTRQIGLMGIFALLGSLLVNNIFLKNIVDRARPYEVIEGLKLLIREPVDSSFPSGHTASSFAVACILFRKLPRKWGIPALVLAGIIAFSRLYLGAHFLSDILFGMLSGILISYMAQWLVEKVIYKESDV